MTFPTGARECEYGACHRGFNSTAAFDAHRQGFRCLEPSSIGLWLATDGLWSIEPRNSEAEQATMREMTRARIARRRAQRSVAQGDEQAARVLREGSDSERAPESAPRGAA